jgi:exosome complex component RRP45
LTGKERFFLLNSIFSLLYADPPAKPNDKRHEDAKSRLSESNLDVESMPNSGIAGESDEAKESVSPKSLKDAVKPKHKRKKKHGKS